MLYYTTFRTKNSLMTSISLLYSSECLNIFTDNRITKNKYDISVIYETITINLYKKFVLSYNLIMENILITLQYE